jgi:hypothetical protein
LQGADPGPQDAATMKADKKIWIALNDQQVGLIMTTLARIQLFFSSSDEEYQGPESQVRPRPRFSFPFF